MDIKMKACNFSRTSQDSLVLPAVGMKAWSMQAGLIAAAVMLPAVAHLTGAPVRWLLPMHWPIIFAALIYGWRGGATVGLMAPFSNWLLTGYPILIKAFPMTLELATYGFIIGWLRQRGWHAFAAVATGLAAGRIIFLAVILFTGANELPVTQYLTAAMLPGLVVGVAQVICLPTLAKMITGR